MDIIAAKTGAKYIRIDAVATPTETMAVSLANLNIPFVITPNIIL